MLQHYRLASETNVTSARPAVVFRDVLSDVEMGPHCLR